MEGGGKVKTYGKCPVCGEILDPEVSDAYIFENDSFETIVRKLFYEHLRQCEDCLFEIINVPDKKFDQCPVCKYDLDPRNSSVDIVDEDPYYYKMRKMLEAHFEADPRCLLKIVSLK